MIMTYEEARKYIDESNQYGSKLGLDTITELMNRLGNPQDKLNVIHIAGTNGKGSTAAFIASILTSAGYRIGRYLSPAVFTYRERIQISNPASGKTTYITEKGVSDTISVVKPVCDAMAGEGLSHPTSFEIETAMAYLYLASEQVDFAVIEVGLGGRLDATNVIKKPVCSVITSISMDHMQFLGDTLGKIAGEKAGIIKKGAPVITSNTNPEVLGVLKQVCGDLNAELTVADAADAQQIRYSPEKTEFLYRGRQYEISLLGEYQLQNAILAAESADVLRRLGYPLKEDQISTGLLHAKWSGRFEIISKAPYFIIDGAHNEDAALQLSHTIQTYFPKRKLIFIMGVLADKDYRKILQLTAGYAKVIFTITPHNSRALSSASLAEEARTYTGGQVIDAVTVNSAVKLAYEKTGKDDVILAFGSLSYLGEIRKCINDRTILP